MADKYRINGVAMSWASITIKIADEDYYGVTEITYGDALEQTQGWGLGKHHAPTRKSRGKYTIENSKLKGYKSTIQEIRRALAALGGSTHYGNIDFQIVIQISEPDEDPITIELVDCSIVKNSSSHSEGADLLQEEIEVLPQKILRNGLTLFDTTEGSP